MRWALPLSALLHALALGAVLARPAARLPPPGQPARIEVIFGHYGAAPAATAAAPLLAPKAGEHAAAEAEPAHPGGAAPGLQTARPDPTMIPARGNPGNRGPDYPPAAQALREQGTVLLRLYIDARGGVSRVEVLHSSGVAALDAAAQTALARWHFLPAERDGKPVESYRDQPVTFVMN